MGQKMRNAPVYFTVAQVRFNPILNLESYLSDIQDKMRKLGFPDYKREDFQRVMIPFGSGVEGQSPQPKLQPQARCFFGDMERTTNFVLESNGFSLQTTEYDTFETFSKHLMDGLMVVHEAIGLAFSERVGLRYLDAVLPVGEEALKDYLAPEVMGLSEKVTGRLSHSFTETVSQNNESGNTLVARVVIQDGEVGLPPEMAGLAPKLNPRFTQKKGMHAIIDTDGFSENREPFSLERLARKLDEIHEEIRHSFDSTVIPNALKIWNEGRGG